MVFRKKKPKRLYYPVKSNWYNKPRKRSASKRSNKAIKKGRNEFFQDLVKKSLYLLITGIAFGILLILLFISSYFSITDIEVVRENFNIDSAAIENELNPYIGRNILFFPKSKIYKTINTHFPEFADIEVRKVFPSSIKINLQSHPIAANLRAYYILPEPEEILEEDFTELNKAIEELTGTTTDLEALGASKILSDDEISQGIFDIEEEEDGPEPIEQKSLLNRIGQAIFDQEENLELMTVTVRQLTQPVEDREQVIPKENMDYMLESIQYFTNTIGLEILGVEYLPVAREIHLKTENNLVIWISIERDFKDQIDKLNIVYESVELNKEDLSYIDLRVGEKIIYCPRNARCDNF